MTVIETAVYATHMVFAGLLTGSVLFAALTVPGIAANVSTSVRESIAGTLRNVSRASAVLLVLTGGYMLTLGGYTDSGVLTGSGRGHAVLGMVVLWFLLTGITEVAGSRIESGDDATTFLYGGAVLAVALLLDAGYLVSLAL
ncbi:hypothetical protein [Halobacterium jilantaiense]|uniref:Transporter n=1 Tax=Halobacterium jilantaiense TaxID=355548 RepID=A0A1I0MU33_9EURY|nr:hypothetical protein [Halobacterium jilantaiense]SEV92226.1 hypothetical protein SAMN04487945_0373 [Halobacterium jilantaiense]